MYIIRDIYIPVTTSESPLPPHWFQILLALANHDRHGLGIMNDVLTQTGGQIRLWPAVLYRNLARLTAAGLVEEIDKPSDAEPGGGRPRFYRITRAGRRACRVEAERLDGYVRMARQKKLFKA
jgi:DNA-binding PadR family transcriptional regulator